MGKIHSYPWYPGDWKQSEARAAMNSEERGIYRELLDHHYAQGSLPSDEAALRSIANATEKEWRRAWPKVSRQFEERGGRLHQKKAVEILAKIEDWHEQKREAGKRSVQARRERKLNDRSTDVVVPFKPSSTTTTTSTTSLPPKPPSGAEHATLEDLASAIHSRHPVHNRSSLEAVQRALWQRVENFANPEAIAAKIDAYHAWMCEFRWIGLDARFAVGLPKWLRSDDCLTERPSDEEGRALLTGPMRESAADRMTREALEELNGL